MQLIDDNYSYEEKLDRGYSPDISSVIKKAVDIFRMKPDFFLLYTALFVFVQPMGGILLAGPLSVGFLVMAHRLDKGKPVDFVNFFDGFNAFVPLLLAYILTTLITIIGYFLFVIPGIYFSVVYLFALPFVYFKKKEFWDAMELSRKLITKEWFSFFGFILLLALLNILGALAFGIGLFFTIPISACAIYVAFDEIVGT